MDKTSYQITESADAVLGLWYLIKSLRSSPWGHLLHWTRTANSSSLFITPCLLYNHKAICLFDYNVGLSLSSGCKVINEENTANNCCNNDTAFQKLWPKPTKCNSNSGQNQYKECAQLAKVNEYDSTFKSCNMGIWNNSSPH